jgi:protein-tyrosine phosphatase
MIDATQIWERLYLGSLLDAERLARANPLGITTVISLSETQACNTQPQITYTHIPIEDTQAIPGRQFSAVMTAIAENLRRGRALIHCGSGVSRAPVVTAAYLHVVGYKDLDATLAEIAVLRPIVCPSAILLASVRELLR